MLLESAAAGPLGRVSVLLFLTSTLIGIRPVRQLEDTRLAVGPLTQQLQAHLTPLLSGQAHSADADV